MAAQRGEMQATRGLALGGAVPTYSRLLRSPAAVSPLTRAAVQPVAAMAAPALLPAPPEAAMVAASPVAVLDPPTAATGGEAGPNATLSVEGGQTIELGALTRIGRRPEMDLVLADTMVSGAHAEVRLIGEVYAVADAGSRNGTFVNEQQVTAPTTLADGDTIRVGSTKIAFAQPQPAPVPAPTPAPSVPDLSEETSPIPPSPVGPAVSGLFVRPESLEETGIPGTGISGALEGGGHRYELLGSQISLGRDPEADVSIEDPAVSYTHAQITLHGGALYLRDLGSRNGTWVNAQLVTTPHQLRDGDVVHVGETDLTFRSVGGRGAPQPPPAAPAEPAAPKALRLRVESGPLAGQTFPLTPPEVVIGRDPDAGISISEGTVSWRHAKLAPSASGWSVTDLGSTNGTAVNGRALEANREHPLEPGSEVRVGEVAMRFEEAP
jgi:pSer/pThr/pTyr-binding forkhead associated (FHA) protein